MYHLALALPALVLANAPLAGTWEHAATFLVDQANTEFAAAARQSDPVPREVRLGRAVTLLNRQPRTQGNLDEAHELLESLVATDPGDEAAIFAAFYLARLDQDYADPPRPAAAATRYRELLAAHPGHPLAEQSATQLVFLEVYADLPPAELVTRFTDFAAIGDTLRDPAAHANFALALGQAALDLDLPPDLALDQLLNADSLGIASPRIELRAWFQIAELARQLDRPAVAERYYTRILETYPRDERATLVRQRLAEIAPPSEPS